MKTRINSFAALPILLALFIILPSCYSEYKPAPATEQDSATSSPQTIDKNEPALDAPAKPDASSTASVTSVAKEPETPPAQAPFPAKLISYTLYEEVVDGKTVTIECKAAADASDDSVTYLEIAKEMTVYFTAMKNVSAIKTVLIVDAKPVAEVVWSPSGAFEGTAATGVYDGFKYALNMIPKDAEPPVSQPEAEPEPQVTETAPDELAAPPEAISTASASVPAVQPEPPAKKPDPEPPQTMGKEQMVWVSGGGKKYHSISSCSNMKDPKQIALEEAKAQGREPCKRCYQ